MADNTETTFSITDSILGSIKQMIGLPTDYEVFNPNVIYLINTYLNVLNQQGVGQNGFAITGEAQTWAQFLGEDKAKFAMAIDYVYVRTKRIFDPSSSSAVMQALKEESDELGWRMNVEAYKGVVAYEDEQ